MQKAQADIIKQLLARLADADAQRDRLISMNERSLAIFEQAILGPQDHQPPAEVVEMTKEEEEKQNQDLMDVARKMVTSYGDRNPAAP